MKKIIVSLAALAALSSMAIAANQPKIVVNTGLAIDNMKVTNQANLDEEIGYQLGAALEYNTKVDKLKFSSDFNLGIYSNYETYAFGVNGIYEVMPKVNASAGLSYNIYNVSGNNPEGFGVQVGLEYKITNNLNTSFQYKYVDLNEGLKYSHNTVLGVKYTF